MKLKLTKLLGVRVASSTHSEFINKAARFGGQSEVLRELIDAFLEDRITIVVRPPKEILK